MPRLMMVALAGLLQLHSGPAAADGSFTLYHDGESGFAIEYPEGWTRAAETPAGSRVKAHFAPGSAEWGETCAVLVDPAYLPPEVEDFHALAAMMTSGTIYQDTVRETWPDAKVIRIGQTTVLGSMPALYAIYTHPFAVAGVPIDFQVIEIVTWSRRDQYTAQCSVAAVMFDEYGPLFSKILGTFVVTDR